MTIPNTVTRIDDGAFSDCSELTSVDIPNSVTFIGYGAFKNCSGIRTLTIGSGVKSIESRAFAYCDKIKEVYAMSSKAVKCDEDIFSDTAYDKATLYVPEVSISSYKSTRPWNYFTIKANPK